MPRENTTADGSAGAAQMKLPRAVQEFRRRRFKLLMQDDRPGCPVESVHWAAGNIAIVRRHEARGTEFPWSSAPSLEAAALLHWVLRHPDNERFFWGTMWPKLLPSRSQIEQCRPYKDDGRNALLMLERYMKARAESEAREAAANGVPNFGEADSAKSGTPSACGDATL